MGIAGHGRRSRWNPERGMCLRLADMACHLPATGLGTRVAVRRQAPGDWPLAQMSDTADLSRRCVARREE